MSNKPAALKPILLYDHLPGILAIYPAVLFVVLGVLSVFQKPLVDVDAAGQKELIQTFQKVAPELPAGTTAESIVRNSLTTPLFNQHMLFWVGLSVMLVWYIAFRFNMPKSKFLLMFGLLGTFVGIPVVLELSGKIRPFSWMSEVLGQLEPTVNTGAWVVMALVFFIIFLGNLIYSRTHMRVRIDESGLTLNRLGGKGERFELIGLKTENETTRLPGAVSGWRRFAVTENPDEQTDFYDEAGHGTLPNSLVPVFQRQIGSHRRDAQLSGESRFCGSR